MTALTWCPEHGALPERFQFQECPWCLPAPLPCPPPSRLRIGQECGQRWYRLRSWRNGPLFRSFPGGFAVGPIMVIWRD